MGEIMRQYLTSNYLLFLVLISLMVFSTDSKSRGKITLVPLSFNEKFTLSVYEIDLPLFDHDTIKIPAEIKQIVSTQREFAEAVVKGDVDFLVEEGMLADSYLNRIQNGEKAEVRKEILRDASLLYKENDSVLTHVFIVSETNTAYVREVISGLYKGKFTEAVWIAEYRLVGDRWVNMVTPRSYSDILMNRFIKSEYPYKYDSINFR